MADYFCHPLWGVTPEDIGNKVPDDLPISLKLKEKLQDWANRYDAILNLDDPPSSCFNSIEDEMLFVEDGCKLASLLQEELGDSYLVTYHSTY